ncbi:MAG: hypothetical protein V1866_01545 [archaeon]
MVVKLSDESDNKYQNFCKYVVDLLYSDDLLSDSLHQDCINIKDRIKTTRSDKGVQTEFCIICDKLYSEEEKIRYNQAKHMLQTYVKKHKLNYSVYNRFVYKITNEYNGVFHHFDNTAGLDFQKIRHNIISTNMIDETNINKMFLSFEFTYKFDIDGETVGKRRTKKGFEQEMRESKIRQANKIINTLFSELSTVLKKIDPCEKETQTLFKKYDIETFYNNLTVEPITEVKYHLLTVRIQAPITKFIPFQTIFFEKALFPEGYDSFPGNFEQIPESRVIITTDTSIGTGYDYHFLFKKFFKRNGVID